MKLSRSHYMFIALVVLVAVIATVYFVTKAPEVAAQGDTVLVFYTGKFTNGTVFNSNQGQQPLTFIIGANQVIPGFDQAVIGMQVNQTKTVTIPANEAYGPINPSLIVTVPLSAFGNLTLHVGNVITEDANGQAYQGVIIAMNKTNATINFNPPLAGQTLVFTIKVVAIQKGTTTA